MTTVQAEEEALEPLIIYRSYNLDGETFALEPRSLKRLRLAFGAEVHIRPRVFLAHETRTGHEQLKSAIVPQVVLLLTGIPEERLRALGGVTFRDPVTDQDLPLTGSLRARFSRSTPYTTRGCFHHAPTVLEVHFPGSTVSTLKSVAPCIQLAFSSSCGTPPPERSALRSIENSP